MEDIIKNDDEKRQECNEYCNRSCDTIDYYEKRSNDGSEDYNKRRYVATKYGEKKDVIQTKSMKEITNEIIINMKRHLNEMKIIKGE